jgi:hypothetical protein
LLFGLFFAFKTRTIDLVHFYDKTPAKNVGTTMVHHTLTQNVSNFGGFFFEKSIITFEIFNKF